MKAQFVNESLNKNHLFESMDINVGRRQNIATIYLDTIDWPTTEQAHDDIYNLNEYLLNEITQELLPEYKVDFDKLEKRGHNVDFIDFYVENGEEQEIWSIELPIEKIKK